MNTCSTLFAILLCGAVSAAAAAAPAPPVPHIRFDSLEHFPLGKVIKNAPYTAETVSERVQTLPDGNQITNTQSTLSYRDSAGRTRQDIRNARGELVTIRLVDAVEGVSYVLNVRQKTAIKVQRLDRGEPARKEIIIKRVEQAGEGAPGPAINDLDGRIKTVIAGAMSDMRWARQASVKDLGSKEIEGVKAQGKLRSYEIPAGAVGNRQAIVVTQENWYAPALQVTVYSKHSDPRTGERTYRLTGIKREEPAPALFAVPSDYTVREPLRKSES